MQHDWWRSGGEEKKENDDLAEAPKGRGGEEVTETKEFVRDARCCVCLWQNEEEDLYFSTANKAESQVFVFAELLFSLLTSLWERRQRPGTAYTYKEDTTRPEHGARCVSLIKSFIY